MTIDEPNMTNEPEAEPTVVSGKEKHDDHALATLHQFLVDDGWFPQDLDERAGYRVIFGGKSGKMLCVAEIRTELQQFIFHVLFPSRVPENLRIAVAEFITRANFGLRIGNFEMDFFDGEVRYKSSLDFEGETLNPRLIRNAIYPAVHTMDQYWPGLMSVVYGGKSPNEAIAEVEGE